MSYLPAQPMIDAVTRVLEPSGLPGRDLAVLTVRAAGGLLLSAASSSGIRTGRDTRSRRGPRVGGSR